jgi:SulP family sulfate permease
MKALDGIGPKVIRQALPFLAWPRPTRESISGDLAAGIAVALLVIPQSLAYAQLAGVPAQHGLYAAFIPSIVGVLYGSSALLSTGPVALTSLLTASSVAVMATPGSSNFVAAVLLVALLSGLLQIGLGLARAGLLLNLLSHPVLVGFVNAAAVVIALSQLPALTGIAMPDSGSTVAGIGKLLTRIDTIHGLSLGLGLLALALLLAFKRWAPQLPGVLVMVAALTALSFASGFAGNGGAVVGEIPAGLPGLVLPSLSWQASIQLFPAAFVIALVSFMEAMSSCKVLAAKTRSPWDENRELIGQGLAKVAAAVCNSMPVSGSFSRSALNLASHGRSGYASLFSAGFVLLTLLFFTSLLYHLPKPALAAMIVLAVANLVDVGAMRNAWRASRDDGVAALLTFVATLAFAPNIQNGILAGITFSLGAFIYRRMLPRLAVHGVAADGSLTNIESVAATPEGQRVVALRFDAALFFANASFFEDAVLKIERENPALEAVVVLAHGVNLLDATAVEMLRGLARHLRERGVELVFSHAKRHVLEVAERTGLLAELGPSNIFDSDESALKTVLQRRIAPARAGRARLRNPVPESQRP